MKKYNNDSQFIKDWSTKKLKKYAIELNDCIYGVNSCYGCNDIILLESIINELDKRGYTTEENRTLCFSRQRRLR